MRYQPKKIYKGLLILGMLLLCSHVRAQVNDITFILDKIKNNYPGYNDKVHGKDFSNWVSGLLSKNNPDTFLLLSRIVNYFNDHHLQIYEPNSLAYKNIDTEGCNNKVKELRDYFANNKIKKDGYEGYWLNDYNSCLMAIVKQRNEPNVYHGFLIESRHKKILPGYLIATFRKKSKQLFETEYLTPGDGSRSSPLTEFRSDSIFTMSDMGKWKKLGKYHNPILPDLAPYNYGIRGKLLDQNTYLLTMPDFWSYNVAVADSLIRSDSLKIRGAQTLIIDIRNNAGGTVSCYASLLPFIYTQPIIRIGGYRFIGNDFVTYKEDIINQYQKELKIDTSELNEMKRELLNFKTHLGQFIYEPGDTFKAATTMPTPKNVAIITNYGCASAAEMMVLDMKQSKKVKTFGEHTLGAVDYLDIFPLELPSQKYILYIPSGKRSIPKGQKKLDRMGIYPDVSITDANKDWVEYVRQYYERK